MTDLNQCRLCLSPRKLHTLQSLNEDGLQNKIYFCVDIQMEDAFSNLICETCVFKINNFYNFKRKCQETYAKFKSSQIITRPDENMKTTTDYEPIHSNCSWPEVAVKSEAEIEHSDANFKTDNIIENTDIFTYQCDLCGGVFNEKSLLKKHLKIHTSAKVFSCKICFKRFTRAEHKNVHMRAHFGIRPYICEICGSTSTKRQDLMRHMKVHSDEKKYTCPKCGRQFKRSGDVSSHMRTHTGARPYGCTMCTKNYTSHSGLRKHMKSHCKKELGSK